MKSKMKSIIFQEDWYHLIAPLPDASWSKVLRILMEKVFDNKDFNKEELDVAEKMALGFILPKIQEASDKYQEVCRKKEEASRRYWREKNKSDDSHVESDDSHVILDDNHVILDDVTKRRNQEEIPPISPKEDIQEEKILPPYNPPKGGGETKGGVKPKRFSKPTVEEIQKYIDEKHYAFTAEAFFNHYESVDWKIGKSPMKNWKAACRTWNEKRKAEQMQSQEQGKDDYDHFLDFCQQHYPNLLASFKSVGSHSFYEVRRLSGNNGRVTDRILTAMNNENFNGDLLAEFERRMRNGEA